MYKLVPPTVTPSRGYWRPLSGVLVSPRVSEHIAVVAREGRLEGLAEQVPCPVWVLQKFERGEVPFTTYGLLSRLFEVLGLGRGWFAPSERNREPMPERVPFTPAMAKKIREARRQQGLKRAQVAFLTGMTDEEVHSVERSQHRSVLRCRLDALKQILRITFEEKDFIPDEVPELWRPRHLNINLEEIPERFRSARKLAGISQEELGRQANVPQNQINQFEKGHRGLGPQRLARLCSALRVRPKSSLGTLLRDHGFQYLGQTRPKPEIEVDWSTQPLGRLSDLEISQQLGVHVSKVWKARKALGIPPAVVPKRGRQKPAPMQNDMILVIDWDRIPLGEIPDTHIADHLGVSFAAVAYARRNRKIPPAPRHLQGESAAGFREKVLKKIPANVLHRQSRIDWSVQPLGLVSDQVLAKQLGVAHSLVSVQRYRRNIPAMTKRNFSKPDLDEPQTSP